MIDKGEFVFLIGPSGSGKSTVLRLLLREELANSGRVTVDGRDVGTPARPQGAGPAPHDRLRLPGLPAAAQEDRLRERRVRARGDQQVAASIKRTVPEVLELVGLEGKAHRLPNELSGGEQQRVAIARAFVNRPLVLLADEPTGNLDPDTSQGIMGLLERINRTGTTVVMATHDNNIVDAMRRRVIELDIGQGRP